MNTAETQELTRIKRFVSGVQNQRTFHEHRHTRGGVSHQWRGPGYYLQTPAMRYLHIDEYKNDVQDELAMYRKNHWCRYFNAEKQLTSKHDPMNLLWPNHAVFYSAHHNKWLNEHADTSIPRDARLFYNEEDWIKYKHMVKTTKNPNLTLERIQEKQNAGLDTQFKNAKKRPPRHPDTQFYF
ncbi:unnamed protein product [Calicophoron daubneyi]|uniref:Uncharacterized protein n=1 Tax=Calicophoron daubneyi TaxID=300641 RepID=A0AAV2TVQ5_CALDB